MENITWVYKSFNEISSLELYYILELRNRVFVVEQNCVYNDADEKDLLCYHLTGYLDGKPVAYCRIVPPGISYAEPSIGRVVTEPALRGKGLGRELMEKSIKLTINQFGTKNIRISAQEYLENFYLSLGFKVIGEAYLEDEIPHVEMLLEK